MDRTNATLTALRRILRATELHSKDVAQSVGLTPVQLRLLKFIGECECATAKSLAVQMRVSQATVTALLDKLEARNLIDRIVYRFDRRQKMISLTPEGRIAVENAPDPIQKIFSTRFEQLADWEKSMLLAAAERIASLLDADDIDAAPILATGNIVDEIEEGFIEPATQP
ncbi:MAG: MarR family transcriptional regulator [Pseudomonadota bacterium]|nr:MarR family transcriptional regulator [Pseudomonadota bacterium]